MMGEYISLDRMYEGHDNGGKLYYEDGVTTWHRVWWCSPSWHTWEVKNGSMDTSSTAGSIDSSGVV